MASPGGTSTSGSEEELQALMEQRRTKRKLSNRESARRSRARKQKAMDDLTNQAYQLREQKNSIRTALSIARANCCVVQAENSVLRTQTWELSSRLRSLSEILLLVHGGTQVVDCELNDPWSLGWMGQTAVASADACRYC